MIATLLATCTSWVLVEETVLGDKHVVTLQCTPTEITCIRRGAEHEVDLRMKGFDTSKNYDFTCVDNRPKN